MTPEQVTEELEASGLRGRGGAGFSMGKKASFIPKANVDKYLVCNADESEPGHVQGPRAHAEEPAHADRGHGHRAPTRPARRESFIYIRGEYVEQADILDAAIARGARRPASSATTSSARASASRSSCTAAPAPTSAARRPGLLDSLEGKRGNPRLKPPFPANQGLYQGPTLINNVETLATMPHIITMGGAEYAKIGAESSTGTKLVSRLGQRPAARATTRSSSASPSREIIYGLAGGPPEGREVKLWFPGGSSSPVLTKDDLDLPYDFNSLAKARSMLGSGAIIVVDDSDPVVDVALKLAKFYRHESCGKCTPCREGTNWTVTMLERIDAGLATPMDLDIMASVQEQIIGNCLCVLGDAMAMPIGSMVAKFRDEFEAHIEAARARNPWAGDDPARSPDPVLVQGAAGA